MPAQHLHTDLRSPQSRRAARTDAYRTRMMLSLALSLGLTTVLLRMPLFWEQQYIGWPTPEMIPLIQESQSSNSVATKHADGSVQTFGLPDAARAVQPAEQEGPDPGNADIQISTNVQRMTARETVYEFVDTPPEIRGGLGAYYINILYPEEAVRQGIEGRLLLRFVVDVEGRPTEITVRKPLHPLCDSAAVRALRDTRFVPGLQNGEKVPVRMHLPVRFRLVEAGTMSATRDSIPPQTP